MIGEVFRNWIHRIEQVFASHGDSVQQRFTHITDTRLGWAERGHMEGLFMHEFPLWNMHCARVLAGKAGLPRR
jgi:hypothetical protein